MVKMLGERGKGRWGGGRRQEERVTGVGRRRRVERDATSRCTPILVRREKTERGRKKTRRSTKKKETTLKALYKKREGLPEKVENIKATKRRYQTRT